MTSEVAQGEGSLSPEFGLSTAEAVARLSEQGPNVIFTPHQVTFWDILWEEVREPMILLLLVVGALYSVFGEIGDAITILIIILLLILAEVQNEFRAKRAVARLAEIASPKAMAIRDGHLEQVEARDIVVGDVLVVASGTRVAADGVLVATLGLQVDESAMTGESFAAEKRLGDDVLAGTVVLSGDGQARVTATGKATRLGALAEGLKAVKPPKTPLQKAMKELSVKLVWVAVFFSVLIPVIGLIQGRPLAEMILVGLSLSFATIPEEMPIIITMVLGLGAYRLSKQNFLVKRLAAAESMGAVSVILTDKTGTLTESRMTLSQTHSLLAEKDALAIALGPVSPTDHTPIDIAIRQRAEELGVEPSQRAIVRERELGDGSKTRAALRDDGVLYVSGAPEEVFAKCADVPREILDVLQAETAKGSREVAVAMRTVSFDVGTTAPWSDLERDMEFVALLSFSDPPRPEVPQAIADMKRAGIRTIMVTGDHPATAGAIAKEVGIAKTADCAVTGSQIDAMDDAELQERVESCPVFARTTPEHKYRILRALQGRGERVAATGDGINDALALKGADIGIAMGIRGTDVAKEAADVVLADDDYATIAHSVFEGRAFYDNLRKGVKYYLSVKSALIGVFLLPALFGLPLPFSPVQIILLELFMDLAASAGFVAEPAEPDVRTRRPVPITTRILDAVQVRDIFLKGFFLFAAVLGAYAYAGATGGSYATQVTFAFSAWMLGHIALAFVSRSEREPLSRIGLLSNRVVNIWALATVALLLIGMNTPVIAARINLVPIPLASLAVLAVAIVAWMSLLELRKYLGRARRPKTEPQLASED